MVKSKVNYSIARKKGTIFWECNRHVDNELIREGELYIYCKTKKKDGSYMTTGYHWMCASKFLGQLIKKYTANQVQFSISNNSKQRIMQAFKNNNIDENEDQEPALQRYLRQDRDFVQRLHRELQDRNRPWIRLLEDDEMEEAPLKQISRGTKRTFEEMDDDNADDSQGPLTQRMRTMDV